MRNICFANGRRWIASSPGLLLPDLAHNDAPTVPDAAATRDSTGARAAAQKRVDTMSTGVQVYWCPRSSSAFARDHELSQHVEEVLTSCAVGSVGARERHGSGAGADVAAVTVSAANWMTSQSMIGTQESHEGMRWQRLFPERSAGAITRPERPCNGVSHGETRVRHTGCSASSRGASACR